MLKRKMFVLTIWAVALFLFVFVTSSRATCPEDTLDRGECDTMYVEPWTSDLFLEGEAPYFVRVPIFVTCDLADVWDSIMGFLIPLCYTHTNPSKYCSISALYNDLCVFPSCQYLPPGGLSIFRHVIEDGDTVIHNRMMDLSQLWDPVPGVVDWDTKILDFGDQVSHFWFVTAASGIRDQAWWEGSRVLLATMTIKAEDTMTICIDTCFWPPNKNLKWGTSDGTVKVPRLGTPHNPASYEVCFSPSYSPVQVTSPTGGEEWCAGSTHDITWDCFGIDNVRIEYAIGAGAGCSWIPIVDSTPCRDESYPWTIPDTLSPSCRVRICDLTYNYPCDYSNGYFSIIQCLPGDANGDQMVGLLDLVFLIIYLYKEGVPPDPMANADVNADCLLDLTDVLYLINYLLRDGPPPLVGCA